MCQSVLGRREGKGLYSDMKSVCKDMEEQRNTESLDITEKFSVDVASVYSEKHVK